MSDIVLKVIGTGSSGNCYILENDSEALVIECGMPFKLVKKALDFQISKIVGAVVSHEHGDHAKYIRDYLACGIPVYTSDATQAALETITGELVTGVPPNKAFQIGGFTIQPFELVHNVPCVGYFIKHRDIGRMIFATDTELIRQNFSKIKLNTIMIETNYSKEIIDNCKFNRNHILQGHMEIDTACKFLTTNDSASLKNVVLIHLSDGNSNEKQFIQKAKDAVHSGVNVYAADTGLEVNLNLCPFMD